MKEVSLKHIAKHFRDTLELHHKESMVVDEKGDRHWTIDLESPLSLWFKEGDTYREDHLLQADVYTEARAMGSELGCCVIMPDRCTRDTVSLPVPSMQSFQGAFEKGWYCGHRYWVVCN